MIRTLTFGPRTDDEQKKFQLFVNLFTVGGNVLHFDPQRGATTRTPSDRRLEAKIVRAYKAISEDLPEGRTLKTEGGAIALEQPAFVLLEKYINAAPGGTQDSDVMDDLIDWVSAAEKSEPKTPTDA